MIDNNGLIPSMHRNEAGAGLVGAAFLDLTVNDIIAIEKSIHGCDGAVYPGRDHQRPKDHILWALPGSKPGAARSGRQSDGYNEAGGKDSERQIHLRGCVHYK